MGPSEPPASRFNSLLPHGSGRQPLRLDESFDPLIEVGTPVSDVSSDSETWWTCPVITPLVEGGDGDAEVFGDFFDCEESVVGVHSEIVEDDPLRRTNRLSNPGELRTSISPG